MIFNKTSTLTAQQVASQHFFQQQQLFQQQLGLQGMCSTPGMSHFGTVKQFRKEFSKFSKEEFRDVSKEPMIKDILSGMTKLNKEQIIRRIKEHLED